MDSAGTTADLSPKQKIALNVWQVKTVLQALQEELSERATLSQALVLMTVADHETVTLQDLAAETKLSAPSIGRITSILGDSKYYGGKEGKNLLTVDLVDYDRLHKKASLSKHGKAFIKSLFSNSD